MGDRVVAAAVAFGVDVAGDVERLEVEQRAVAYEAAIVLVIDRVAAAAALPRCR